MVTLVATPAAKSKSCTNGKRSPQAMSHQWRNLTTRNDNGGEKFITNQRRNPPPTTATSTAKSKSIINDTKPPERLRERQFTTCKESTKLQQTQTKPLKQHLPGKKNKEKMIMLSDYRWSVQYLKLYKYINKIKLTLNIKK